MKIWTVFANILFAFALCAGCATQTHKKQISVGQTPQSLETTITKTLQSNYLLYLPNQYQATKKKWPLLLFLHGSGEAGNDLEKVKIHGPPKLIAEESKAFPFVVVSPQSPANSWWGSTLQIEVVNNLLDHIVSTYRIDEERIYVTGLSMGGFGTWRLATTYPDRFAAIAPICGGGDPEAAASISHLPIWVFHGAKDTAVPIEQSKAMVTALEGAGGKVKFTIYPDGGHDVWTETYQNPELYDWLLSHTRSDNARTKAATAEEQDQIASGTEGSPRKP